MFEKAKIGNNVIQNNRTIISWDKFDKCNSIKMKVYNRKCESSFKNNMLILTNKKIKEVLGCEKSQSQEFKVRQRLLLISFYIASYFCQIRGRIVEYNDHSILLAAIGRGKGNVVQHFIIGVIQQWLNHLLISYRILSKEEQIALFNSFEILI